MTNVGCMKVCFARRKGENLHSTDTTGLYLRFPIDQVTGQLVIPPAKYRQSRRLLRVWAKGCNLLGSIYGDNNGIDRI